MERNEYALYLSGLNESFAFQTPPEPAFAKAAAGGLGPPDNPSVAGRPGPEDMQQIEKEIQGLELRLMQAFARTAPADRARLDRGGGVKERLSRLIRDPKYQQMLVHGNIYGLPE